MQAEGRPTGGVRQLIATGWPAGGHKADDLVPFVWPVHKRQPESAICRSFTISGWATIGPPDTALVSWATTEAVDLQGRSETGATGLEPATSGVTDRFGRSDARLRSPLIYFVCRPFPQFSWLIPHGCVDPASVVWATIGPDAVVWPMLSRRPLRREHARPWVCRHARCVPGCSAESVCTKVGDYGGHPGPVGQLADRHQLGLMRRPPIHQKRMI